MMKLVKPRQPSADAEDAAPIVIEAPSPLYLEHLKAINATFYDQLKVVDQKAAYIFTFIVAFLIWSADVRGLFSHAARPDMGLDWLISALMAGSVIGSTVGAILVVLPRSRGGGSSLYWGAWPHAGANLVALNSADGLALLAEEYRTNIGNLAALCRQKYWWMSVAFRSLLLALATYVVSLLLR
jgi:hypothetical protein